MQGFSKFDINEIARSNQSVQFLSATALSAAPLSFSASNSKLSLFVSVISEAIPFPIVLSFSSLNTSALFISPGIGPALGGGEDTGVLGAPQPFLFSLAHVPHEDR